MSWWTTLLIAACAGPGPEARRGTETLDRLGVGAHQARSVDQPAWQLELEAGQTVQLGALSDKADVVLRIESPGGKVVEAASSRLEHRTANLRYTAGAAGLHRVWVSGLLAEERGDVWLIRREPIPGTLCAQLQLLSEGDLWALAGAEHSRDDPARRTRSLVAVMPWAHECTVNRLGDLDVGASCALSGVGKQEGLAVYAAVETEFRSCHGGWMFMEESDPQTREVVAEKSGALHFVRLRDNGERGWQVSVGAMPAM